MPSGKTESASACPRPAAQASRVEVVEGTGRVRFRTGVHEPLGLVEQRLALGVDLRAYAFRHPGRLNLHGITGRARGHLLVRPVPRADGVLPGVMRVEPVRQALKER